MAYVAIRQKQKSKGFEWTSVFFSLVQSCKNGGETKVNVTMFYLSINIEDTHENS